MAYTADKKPTELTALTTLAVGDVFVVGDVSDADEVAKQITYANLLTALSSATQTLTNKTIDADNNTISNIALGAEATGAMADLSNVTITSIASGEILKWNGTAFINNTLAEAGISPTSHTHVKADITDLTAYEVGGTDVAVVDGGTGASTASGARTNLGLVIGTDVQTQGAVLDDLNTLGANSADSEFLVGTGAGALAWESGATARTSLGVDPAGTDNSTNVTLAGTPNYLTISGQAITLNKLDITDDTNLVAGTGLTLSTNTLAVDLNELTTETAIASGDFIAMVDITDSGSGKITFANLESTLNHDNLTGFVANEHLDWTQTGVGTIHINNIADASTTAQGVVELATTAEVDTGTDTARAITPDALAGSNLGIRYMQAVVFDFATDTATGDGKFYAHIPAGMDGMNLVEVHAEVITAGTTGTTDIQINNVDNALDMLSTKLTIDSAETGSDTAATAAVINTSNDHVNENDVIRIDVDAVSTTAAKGLIITMGFQTP